MDFENINFDDFFKGSDIKFEKQISPKTKSKAKKTINYHKLRRITSERNLEEIMDWEFEKGSCYHIISQGDIDSLSYLKWILRQQKVNYMTLSTWCLALTDIEEIERYLEIGRIKRIDFYCGEIFKGSYGKEYNALVELMKKYKGRLCIFRNHSKVMSGFGEKFDFSIESSANVNTNPRCEQTTITVNSELALFYKNFFDEIISFERNFDDWKPYKIEGDLSG